MEKHYCPNLFKYIRRKTSPVKVGGLTIGGENDICVQTMTNTSTGDVVKTSNQVIEAYKSGAQMVRITVPSKKDVENLKEIKKYIQKLGYNIPLVADIHFNQQIAFEAAKVVEKVRINPGNFADSKKFQKLNYSDEEYSEEINRIRNEFVPLLKICKEHNTALRIGSNHGSLSDRIMSKYGDTPEGMAESAMEFLRICKDENFYDVIISMKASNTMVMVHATRLLVAKMEHEHMSFPLHLGVTEAGEGEDGRIKSAVGVGTLLADGIGDTIRISLTEPPENEIPVAQMLVDYLKERVNHKEIPSEDNYPVHSFSFKRRETRATGNIGGKNVPIVISSSETWLDLTPDYIISSEEEMEKLNFVPYFSDEVDANLSQQLKLTPPKAIILKTRNVNGFADQRAAIVRLINDGNKIPVILHRCYHESNEENFRIKAAADLGGLLLDGLADGIWLENEGEIDNNTIISTAFGILQASRMRVTKPEYISCPSCGRTLFNLQETTRIIREKTAHLKGLKIGIMGCIVNGLGEMADADYGYIGSGPGKVNLYFNKELIKKGIPEHLAVEELVSLIKQKGDWHEPN